MAAAVGKTVAEMFGEFLREAAVLTAVFLPMDWILVEKNAVSWTFVWVAAGLSTRLLAAGVVLEKVRRKEEPGEL